mgnify:FL=1
MFLLSYEILQMLSINYISFDAFFKENIKLKVRNVPKKQYRCLNQSIIGFG